ncbi:MAG: DUF4340 domain-containing protein [Acidobacteria bacterium]|jgi:hypothetical protein|nr:DUF4340 domain-containing protein [Acidobacteriota bacterium]
MNWKKIAVLAFVLALLSATIVFVNQKEKAKLAVEGILFDIPAATIEKIELRNKTDRFSFSRRDVLWHLDAPLAAKADKAVLEGILDNFCRLKYDRLVAENAAALKDFGLDEPEIELKLIAKGRPATIILLGMKNTIDDSSYAKLGDGSKVVTIASYLRQALEKDLFAFRDKKVLEIDTMAVAALEYRRESSVLAFAKKEGRWFLEKPLYSLAQESKVSDLLAAVADLQAISFAPAPGSGAFGEFGLDQPALVAEFRSTSGSRKIAVGRKGEQYYALAAGATEICGIAKDLLDKFAADAAVFREKKVAPFFAFDANEIAFRRGDFRFSARKDASGAWKLDREVPGKKLSQEKIETLLTSLADLEAREFMDEARALPPFPIRITMKTEDPARGEKPGSIAIELGDAEGETVIVRNPALPYQFKVGKEFLQKLPTKLDDLCAGGVNGDVPAGQGG